MKSSRDEFNGLPVEVSGPSGLPLDAIDVMSVEVRFIQIFDDDDDDNYDDDDDDVISYCHEASLSSILSSTHPDDYLAYLPVFTEIASSMYL